MQIKFIVSKCVKMADFVLLESPELISRKIEASKCDTIAEFALLESPKLISRKNQGL